MSPRNGDSPSLSVESKQLKRMLNWNQMAQTSSTAKIMVLLLLGINGVRFSANNNFVAQPIFVIQQPSLNSFKLE
jgi:hypothetical protein